MHEVAVMQSALGAILRQAQAHHATRVHRVVLRIGALSGVEPESLRFAFDVVTRDTLAQDAQLDIEPVPARAHCATCGENFTVEDSYIFSCPRCHGLSGDIREGRELELSHLEMS